MNDRNDDHKMEAKNKIQVHEDFSLRTVISTNIILIGKTLSHGLPALSHMWRHVNWSDALS